MVCVASSLDPFQAGAVISMRDHHFRNCHGVLVSDSGFVATCAFNSGRRRLTSRGLCGLLLPPGRVLGVFFVVAVAVAVAVAV
eukprot:2331782-Alexandrium_andersonii.AAC.1